MTIAKSDELDGLGSIVGDLLSDNLAAEPSRRALVNGRPWTAVVSIPEAESTFRIEFTETEIAVVPQTGADAELEITTDGETILEIPAVALLAGLPSPFAPSGRDLLRKLLRGQLSVGGLIRHIMLLRKTLRILNTAQLD